MAKKAAGGLSFDVSQLSGGLKTLEDKAKVAMEIKVQTKYVNQLQAYAQTKARWTNRTGEARRRLKASYEVLSSGYKLILAHGVQYGIWLELAHEKRFSIIPETIQKVGVENILPDFEKFIEKLSASIGGK